MDLSESDGRTSDVAITVAPDAPPAGSVAPPVAAPAAGVAPRVVSLRALDALNFCNAGIQTGLGPFQAIFYTHDLHWNPGQIGLVIACQALAGIALQSFVGSWVDRSRRKKYLTAAAALVTAAGALGITATRSFAAQIVIQIVIGLSTTVFPAATAAFALGLSRWGDETSRRVGRSESFTHAGNAVFAIAAGVLGTAFSFATIFYAAAVFALGMAVSAAFIAEHVVDAAAARGGLENSGGARAPSRPLALLVADRRVLAFAVAVVLFNVADCATLNLVGEILSTANGGASAWQIASAVLTAEIVMIGAAFATGYTTERLGRKPLLLLAFALLAVRDVLSTASHAAAFLIGLQVLDGAAAAIYGVLLTLVVGDLARGTGAFNLLKGAMQSSMGLGAFISNWVFGVVARRAGFNAAFVGLAAVALAGGAVQAIAMPETRRSGDPRAAG